MRPQLPLIQVVLFCVVGILLWGRPPLAQSVDDLKLKMLISQVRSMFGPERKFESGEYKAFLQLENYHLEDGFYKADSIRYQFKPAFFTQTSAGLKLFEEHNGLPGIQFEVPVKDILYRHIKKDHVYFWIDRSHCLWVLTDEAQRVMKWKLVPVSIEPAKFSARCEYLWRKIKSLVRW